MTKQVKQIGKVCPKCNKRKPLEVFGKDRRCKLCCNEKSKKYRDNNRDKVKSSLASWRKSNPDKVKVQLRRARLKKFKLSETHYQSLLKEQNYVCAICALPEKLVDRAGRLKALAVDHCHKTGKVRGLLCFDCNTALGKFNEDVEIIASACEYLERDFMEIV